jgi:pilus assembly protein CpaE
VVYSEDAISTDDVAALKGQFPNLVFERLGAKWPEHFSPSLNILIVGISAASGQEVEKALDLVRACPSRLHVLIALRDADVASSLALTRAGAADVIPLPASQAVWTLAIERLLARDISPVREEGKKPGQVVVLLKAGGGVGATSLGVQAAYQLAARTGQNPGICFADLDLQFGAAAFYFDLSEALTVTDCVAVGEVLEETQFATELAAHKSGIRVLAAPREASPLDMLTPKMTEALIGGLRRDFALTILDLPSVWTAWTNHAIHLADRIVMVTQLSVPHVHSVRRQLAILAGQGLDRMPLTLVCNAVSGDQQNLLSVKSAEKALGRSFNLVLPEDVRAMGAATNQGLPLAEARRGTKLEKHIGQLADMIAVDALTAQKARR